MLGYIFLAILTIAISVIVYIALKVTSVNSVREFIYGTVPYTKNISKDEKALFYIFSTDGKNIAPNKVFNVTTYARKLFNDKKIVLERDPGNLYIVK